MNIKKHLVPEHPEKPVWLSEPDPVRVYPPKVWQGGLRALMRGRSNLLAVWPERAYTSMTLSLRLLRQQYFLCNSPDTVRRVFLDEHDNYDRKSPQMRHALEPLLGDGLFVSDGALWKERRDYCAPAFENELLPGYAEVMSDCAGLLAARWASLPDGSQVDMLNEMARLTAGIIGRTVFGDETSEEEAAQVVLGFSGYQQHVEQMRLSDILGLPFLRWCVNPLRLLRSRRAAARVHEVIDRIIERQRQGQSMKRFALLSLLLEGHTGRNGAEKKCPLSGLAARNEAIVMFMAGHETTANALAWVWYLLAHSPRVAAKLHEELDSVLGGRAPGLADVPDLPYTRAVFEEALRLYPPVPLLSREARAEDAIRGRAVDAGANILVSPWLLHRHTLFWEHPDKFIPERFMPGNPRPDKFIYLPFSVGRRVCLGLRFGLTEGVLCLATLAQRFEAQLDSGHVVEIECRLTLRPKDGLPMRLKRRL